MTSDVPEGKREVMDSPSAAAGAATPAEARLFEALRRREQQLAALIDSSPNIITRLDRNLRHEFVNRALERLLGVPAVDWIGRTIDEVVRDPRVAAAVTPAVREVFETGAERWVAFEAETPLGVRSYETRAVPEFDEDQHVRSVLCVTYDRTDRVIAERALRSSDALVASVVSTAVDGILVVDEEGRIDLFNPAAERLFGYSAGEVLGRNVSMLMPEWHAGKHDSYLKRYRRTGKTHIIGAGREVEGRRKDGSMFPMQLSVSEMRVDGVRRFTGTVHDLTSQKWTERALREQESAARLGQMAAVVAHEVKNPLAGLSGALQIMRGRRQDSDPERALIDEMLTRIRSLNRLVDDLLVFARPVGLETVPTDMTALVGDVVRLLGDDPQISRHDVRLSAPADPVNVVVDPALIGAVITNLMLNAGQAMREPGTITLEIAAEEGLCRVTVTDTGEGVPAHLRGQLFEPFVTTKKGGTGLGLPISRRTLRLHGGDLELAFSGESGATFLATLPLAGKAT